MIENAPEHIPDGSSLIVDADQWHEDGYVIKENLVVPYFVDMKDPQSGMGKGAVIEEFLADPEVKVRAKEWVRGLLRE
jgi:hypothetical protein